MNNTLKEWGYEGVSVLIDDLLGIDNTTSTSQSSLHFMQSLLLHLRKLGRSRIVSGKRADVFEIDLTISSLGLNIGIDHYFRLAVSPFPRVYFPSNLSFRQQRKIIKASFRMMNS